MTLRQNLGLGVAGALAGLGVAVVLTRYLATVLYEVHPLAALTFGFAGVGVLAVVVLASLMPASVPHVWIRWRCSVPSSRVAPHGPARPPDDSA